MYWIHRTFLVLGIGLCATLCSAWLPVLAGASQTRPGFAWAIMWTRTNGPCSTSVYIDESTFLDSYAMESFRAADGNYAGGPAPESVMTRPRAKLALSRLTAILDAAPVGEGRTPIGAVQFSGWPARCALAECRYDRSGVASMTGGFAPARQVTSGVSPRMLPYGPLWRGVLINLAFWSTFPGLALLAFGGARRAWRALRRSCRVCGYSLAGLAPGAPCPECGKVPA